MTDQAPIRQRTRPEPDVALPDSVVEYVEEHFGGTWPTDDHHAILRMMEACFSSHAYREHRHNVVDRMVRAGYTVAQLALTFGKDERTIWRWKNEMREFFAQGFSLRTVREIHDERMTDLHVQMRFCDEVIFSLTSTMREKVAMMRTKQRWHAMLDQILREGGYYEAFDIGKLGQSASPEASRAEQFIANLDQALLEGRDTFEVPEPGDSE